MGSTNKTAHYELPQFVANDKPSWLGDVNEAMEAIDTGIYGAKSSADGAQQTANNAVAGVASAGTRMDGIQTQLDTVATQANQTATTVAGHTSSIATNSANINTLNSRMGSTDISAIGDGTVTGAISAISGGGGGGTGLEVVESGTATISTSAKVSPLVLIDGMEGDLNSLNPQDVDNISVLKDASAASIYGSRAAGGVIMLKTKTAKTQDRVSIKYSNNFSWSNATYLPDYGTVPSQIQALSQANKRAGLANELFGMYLDTMLPYAEAWEQQNGGKKAGYREMRPFKSMSDVGDYYVNPDGSGAMYYANWDVQDIMFQTAPSQTHNLSVSGSTGKANYYLAFGYSEKEGQMNFNPDKLQRYNVNANFNVALTNWLETGFRFNFVNKTYDMPNRWRNTYTYMWRWGSFFGPYGYMLDANGTPVDGVNGIAYQKQAGNDHDVTSFTRINSYIKAKILDGLTFQADFTYDLTNRNNEYAYIPVYVFNTWGGNISEPYYGVSQSATYQTQTNTKVGRWTTNIFGSYEKTFNEDHNMKVMAGFTADKEQNRYFSAKRTALNDNDLPELNLATGTQTVTSSASHWATAGFFGRINYDYKGKYLAEISGRYDGTSKFAKGSRWGIFPSASLGWRISEEDWFNKNTVNNLKLRASFGSLGNQNVTAYQFVRKVTVEDFKGYNFNYGEIWHTERDLYTKSIPEYMEHTSVVTAIVALGVANLKHQLSREGMYTDQ